MILGPHFLVAAHLVDRGPGRVPRLDPQMMTPPRNRSARGGGPSVFLRRRSAVAGSTDAEEGEYAGARRPETASRQPHPPLGRLPCLGALAGGGCR
jgi:hypothetical protein